MGRTDTSGGSDLFTTPGKEQLWQLGDFPQRARGSCSQARTANCVMRWVLGQAAKPTWGGRLCTLPLLGADSQARQGYARRSRNGSLEKHTASESDRWGPGGREQLLFPLEGRDLAGQGGYGKLRQYCWRPGYGSGCQSPAAMFGGRITHQRGC